VVGYPATPAAPRYRHLLSNNGQHLMQDWRGAEERADQMRMFRVIAVGFLLAAPIAAQAQGVSRGVNYGVHRGAYTGYSVLGPVGGFVGGVVGGAAGGVVGGVNGVFGINPHPHRYYRRYRR
jgi:hypothetical protein